MEAGAKAIFVNSLYTRHPLKFTVSVKSQLNPEKMVPIRPEEVSLVPPALVVIGCFMQPLFGGAQQLCTNPPRPPPTSPVW